MGWCGSRPTWTAPTASWVGLTARQLAILAAGGVAAWTLMGLLEPLVGLPAAAVLAAPLALAAMALALGWRDGLPLDRLAVAGLGWWRQPSRLVVAPDGIPPAPAWAGRARPAGWRRSRGRSVAWIPPGWWIWAGRGGRWCVWPPRSTSACGPRPSSRPCWPASPGSCTRWPAPCRCWSAATAPTSPRYSHTLRERAAALPDPGLEQAALAHARWLEALTGDQQVRRRQLLVVFHQPASTTTPAAALHRQAEQAAGLLAVAGVTLTPLDGDAAAQALAAATNPDGPPRPAGLAPPAAIITGRPT